ncbi:MAG: carboxypeptidase-like regulatory domain-containing protein [Actinobacteria bacterium]|nr:carboxypeptidase-like regulatory domain-containing protein [Actinomycetota bacterium]
MSRPEDEEFTRLMDWVEGRLSEQEARAVEGQVAAGGAKRADVAWLRAFARVSEDTVIASPPSVVRDALVERFYAYAEGKQHPGLLQRLVATLTFDSNVQPAAGLRAARAQESQRQLVYSTDAADVAMIVHPRARDELLDLYGQILPVDSADSGVFGVQLLEGSSEVATTATNDLGEFTFEAVPPGVYEVLAGSDRVEIRIPDVELNS